DPTGVSELSEFVDGFFEEYGCKLSELFISVPDPDFTQGQTIMDEYKEKGLNDFHWYVNMNYKLPMTLNLSHKGTKVFNHSPKEPQWWITGFNPNCTPVLFQDLTVTGTVDFSKQPDLWKGFYSKNKIYTRFFTFQSQNMIANFEW
ncbi:MAG: hypothetical protein LBL96_09920, partial [Clostridiales bacterium]|nr:hypothetical protein [Clostridiales bacterium]